jgi:hypothetical protein
MALLDIIKAKGFEVSPLKMLEEVETLGAGVTKKEFELYISATYEDSASIRVLGDSESKFIPFWKGEIDTASFETNDKGLVNPNDVNFTVTVKSFKVLRDGEGDYANMKKGDIVLRAFVD